MRKISMLLVFVGTLSGLWIDRAWGDVAASHYQQAMALKRQGKISEAIAELKKALEARADYTAAHYSIGILYRQDGQVPLAIKHLEEAARLDPNAGNIQYSLALAYYKSGNETAAIPVMRRAAELSPKDPQVLAQLGTLLIRRDPREAITYLEQAVKLQPDEADHHHQLGLAYRRLSQEFTGSKKAPNKELTRNLELAERELLIAARLKDDAEIEFDLGVVYRRLGEVKKAITHYEKAIGLNPKLAAAYWDLAHMYVQDKRDDVALEAFREYVKLAGDSKDAEEARVRIKELTSKSKKK